jgi:cytochrome d ubiquinol oxidase subunit II
MTVRHEGTHAGRSGRDTLFSGFYLALLIVLFCLIIRAVAIEFRSKIESDVWRKRWDVTFSISSTLPMLLFGVALGNILRGIPLDQSKTFT